MPKFATKYGFGRRKKGTKPRGVHATKSKSTKILSEDCSICDPIAANQVKSKL